MLTKKEILDRLDEMADFTLEVSSDLKAITEMKDLPDQWQGLYPAELEWLLKNFDRVTYPDVAENPHWDPKSLEGLQKLGYLHVPKEIHGTEDPDHIPYEMCWDDPEDKDLKEGSVDHFEKMQSLSHQKREMEVELADGSIVVLDPATLQDICSSKHFKRFPSYLGHAASFSNFLKDVYAADKHDEYEPEHHHAGNGAHPEFGSEGGGE